MIRVKYDKFVLARLPNLMEDEGNWQVLAIFDNLQELAEFSKEFTESDTGYFKVWDLIFIGSPCGEGGPVTDELKPFMPRNIKYYMESVYEESNDYNS